jgi:hypothetical protein
LSSVTELRSTQLRIVEGMQLKLRLRRGILETLLIVMNRL